jgi:hypothetical protein
MALPLLLGFGLPALAGSGALAGLGAAGTFLGGLSAPTLAGIGAGLGSFLETGDVGKGIQTGLIAGLGGKAMGALTGGGNAALSGAIGGTEGAAQAAINASAVEGGKNAFLQGITNKSLQGGLAGAVLPGVGTAALVGSAMNPPTMKMPEKEKVDVPPPMPRIRSYQPKTDMDSTAEEEMITYYNPVKRMRGGGIMSMSGSHPIFQSFGDNMAGFLTQAQVESNKEKVQPFVQEVETLARNTFGQDAFQQRPVQNSLQPQPMMPMQDAAVRAMLDRSSGNRTAQVQFAPPPSLGRGKGQIGTPAFFEGVSSEPPRPSPFGRNMGAKNLLRLGAVGYAEGGEVEAPEDMNEKDVIVEAVKAIKGLSDAPDIALGIFLDKYGQEALEDLVEKVQSGALDDTIERFANGDKGMVEGMGDGSGEDDMIPATMDGEQDVLLTEGEFVMRQPTTKAIQDEFGSDFLDIINQSEEKAPEKIREMVGVES